MNRLDVIKIYILLNLVKAYSETLEKNFTEDKAHPVFYGIKSISPRSAIEQEEITKVLEKLIRIVVNSTENSKSKIFNAFMEKNEWKIWTKDLLFKINKRKIMNTKNNRFIFLNFPDHFRAT